MLIVNTKTILKNKLKQIVHGKRINMHLIYTTVDTWNNNITHHVILLSRCLYILGVLQTINTIQLFDKISKHSHNN